MLLLLRHIINSELSLLQSWCSFLSCDCHLWKMLLPATWKNSHTHTYSSYLKLLVNFLLVYVHLCFALRASHIFLLSKKIFSSNDEGDTLDGHPTSTYCSGWEQGCFWDSQTRNQSAINTSALEKNVRHNGQLTIHLDRLCAPLQLINLKDRLPGVMPLLLNYRFHARPSVNFHLRNISLAK